MNGRENNPVVVGVVALGTNTRDFGSQSAQSAHISTSTVRHKRAKRTDKLRQVCCSAIDPVDGCFIIEGTWVLVLRTASPQ